MSGGPAINEPAAQRPRVLISRCLLGERVRYDGSHRRLTCLDTIARHATLIGVCPEMAAGLGTPRPTLGIVEIEPDGTPRIVRHQDRCEMTGALQAATHRLLAYAGRIDGCILKARSPSCGLGDAPLLDRALQSTDKYTDGLFAAAVRRAFPHAALANEDDLADSRGRNHFLAQLEGSAAWTAQPR